MTEHPPELDRETAERLLGGAGATHGAGASRLADLLASAAAPPRAHELSGEDTAVMAFRAAQGAQPSQASRFSWRRLLTVKAAIAAAAAVLVGGLAFASTTGIIPGPFPPDPPSSSSPSPSAVPTTGPAESVAPSTERPAQSTPAAESIAGLCQAYLAKAPGERGKALESPALSNLVAAAGGADRVEAYCAGQPDRKPDKSKHPRPSKPSIPGPPPGAASHGRDGIPAIDAIGDGQQLQCYPISRTPCAKPGSPDR